MKKGKTAVGLLVLALAAYLGFQVTKPAKPVSAEVAPAAISNPNEPTDRTPEQYQGSFLDTSLSAMLNRLDVKVFPEDKVFAFPDPSLGLGSQIKVFRAQPVVVQDGKSQKLVRTWAKTINDFVNEQNLELGDQDIITPARGSDLPVQSQALSVIINRVAVTEISQTVPIDFSTTKQNDNTMDQGTTKVKQPGVPGKKQLTYRVTRQDGVEVSRVLIASTVTQPPQTEIILVGTRPVITVRCAFKDTVLAASIKYGIDPNALCYRMMAESNGHTTSVGAGQYYGLFQYTSGFWASASASAGYAGASWTDATAQIYTTAWAWSHGQRGRWPNP